jgi:CP family cyanate transporter-like MFS transporter
MVTHGAAATTLARDGAAAGPPVRRRPNPHYDSDVTELPARPPTQATPLPPAPRADAATIGAAPATPALLTVGVLLLAANLRPVAASVGPLVHQLRSGLHLSGATAGLLLTIPVLCFGAVAPVAPVLARRLGLERTLGLVLLAITGGLVLRVTGGVALLFAGTTLAAAGAACGNVLLPVLVRRSFADRVGRTSAWYTASLVSVAALAAAITVPLAHALGEGWRGGLAFWALPAFVALAVWLPRLSRGPAAPVGDTPRPRLRDVTRSPIAWSLTLFFALQSWGYYSTLAWLPSIFESHGLSSTSAGLLLGLCGAMALPGALIGPRLAARMRDQRRLVVGLTVVNAVGVAGLLAAPASAPVVWALVIGIGQGALFPLALTMIVLRSGSPQITASLSTHVQSIGYLLAAAGPLAIGALHDATGSWSVPVALLLALLGLQVIAGSQAGRNRVLGERSSLV